jgi:hypothetical protein
MDAKERLFGHVAQALGSVSALAISHFRRGSRQFDGLS